MSSLSSIFPTAHSRNLDVTGLNRLVNLKFRSIALPVETVEICYLNLISYKYFGKRIKSWNLAMFPEDNHPLGILILIINDAGGMANGGKTHQLSFSKELIARNLYLPNIKNLK